MKHFLTILFLLNAALGDSQEVNEEQLERIDFKKVEAEISIFPEEGKVEGDATYKFEILRQTDSVFIDAKNMEIIELTYNGDKVEFRNNGEKLWIKDVFLPSSQNQISFKYSAKPEQSMYFINWEAPDDLDARRQVWTQGQGKNTSHWLPSFDDLNEKAEFDLRINFKENYKVVANGKLLETVSVNDSILQWRYDMEEPMSSYLVAIAAGKFDEQKLNAASGVPIYLYINPEDSVKFEPTYRHSKEVFDFLEEEIGVPYPWQNYKQIPVQDFLYAGMENTGTTIFSNALVTDETGFKDRNYVNVNAHELAHQWFGNLVSATDSEHHWLHEGFATYYALLAEREIFGDEYYYWKLYETAEQLKDLSDSGKGEALLNANASSLTFYQKGAWALHILREKVGDEAFREAVKNYLELYQFQNVSTANFIAEVERSSNEDLSQFMADWLLQSAFQGTEALNSLKRSKFIRNYLKVAALRETPLSEKTQQLNRALDFPVNDYIGQEVVFQLAGENSPEAIELYKKAFETENVFVRQAIASGMDVIPRQLKSSFESLLHDNSYLTQEIALMKLWSQFPQDIASYLDLTMGTEGFYNKNVRLLWLTLNLVSPKYDYENQQEVFEELAGYTAPHQPFELRENAFGFLYQINSFKEKNLRDLLQGTQHHNTNFRKFCRQLLDELLKEEEYREKYSALVDSLPEREQEFLNEKLKD